MPFLQPFDIRIHFPYTLLQIKQWTVIAKPGILG